MDLVIRNATLPDGRAGIDIGTQGGRIAAVEPRLPAAGRQEIDAGGLLVTPPFVDAHFHMDATLSYGLPRVNASGTLLEGIGLWGELKPELTQAAIAERALRYCDWAVARGLLAIRTHVDIGDDRVAVEALLEVKRTVAPYSRPAAGGLPAGRPAAQPDGVRQSQRSGPSPWASMWSAAFPISNARWSRAPNRCACCAPLPPTGDCVDMHCDETDDPLSRHIETCRPAPTKWACTAGWPARI